METTVCSIGCQEAIQTHLTSSEAQVSAREIESSGKETTTLSARCDSPQVIGVGHGRGGRRCRRSGRSKDTRSRILEDIACSVMCEHWGHTLIERCVEYTQSILTIILIDSTDQE